MKGLNCPNCGAPITGYKCEYCGTVFKQPWRGVLYADGIPFAYADEDYVNSAITSNMALCLGVFDSYRDLAAHPARNGDYAFVIKRDSESYEKYIYHAWREEWIFEYELNAEEFEVIV